MFKVLSLYSNTGPETSFHSSIASSTTVCRRPDQTSTKRC